MTKHVATSPSAPLGWQNSVALKGDVAAEIARLKQGDGPMLLTQRSNVLLQTLLAHHLIDEFLPLPPCWSSDDQQARREQMKRES